MLTPAALDSLLDPGPPTFYGTLDIVLGRHREPVLLLTHHCPHCRRGHTHGWGLNDDGSECWSPFGRQPHCLNDRHPFGHRGYQVAPAPTEANRRTYRRFAELLARFEQRTRA